MRTKFLSASQAASMLNVTRQTLYKLFEKGEIPGKRIGGKYIFTEERLLNYLNETSDKSDKQVKVWELRGDFATQGIKKMAKRTFQELASNIEELIVNAYDADATVVQIILNQDKRTLSVIDDGNGMNEATLESYVKYGESNKTSSYRSPKFGRAPIGEYGMGGKLSITNICNNCKIITRRDGKEHIFSMNRVDLDKAKYLSDIKNNVYTKKCSQEIHGTQIFMEKLLSKNIDENRLYERFSAKMPISQNFKIELVVIKNGEQHNHEVKEVIFDYVKKFEFSENLLRIGPAKMTIYYTKDAVPYTRQGVWTKVNGRIVNEKAEWFDLFKATSGNRYRYRLFGYGEADGLKDFVTFSKNDFISCPEYEEYWQFGHKSITKVQNLLLSDDEDTKKQADRNSIKELEKQINEMVSKLDTPEMLGHIQSKVKKEYTKEKENAPETPYPNIEQIEEDAEKIADAVKRTKDKRERRNQSITPSERANFSGKNYTISTVDLSRSGDLVKFTKEKNLIEVNERHPLYERSSKDGNLTQLVRDLAFTQISNDYAEGNMVVFNTYFNELAKISMNTSFLTNDQHL